VRLGLLSTARINGAIIEAAGASDAVEVVAVASRSRLRAARYARRHGIARAHGSYDALLADPAVEAVYVSLPNGLHAEWTTRALEAGKHVLCEKPFSPRPDEVERCFDLAEERGLVLSEAFMWRHHPQAAKLAELVHGGAIGELRTITAVFSFVLDRRGDPRWEPALDGGALMDVGCYCVSAARLLAGEPEQVTGEAVRAPSGVDVRFDGRLEFPGGVTAAFSCALDRPPESRLTAMGADGEITLADPWHGRDPVIELRRDGAAERIDVERADSYRLELEDVAAAIRDGRPPRLGREDALGQARVLEALLA
jgi:D-xylose 1-dehydrogenase (NADP+, D-xylono-1,5-lactone-forming)